VSKSQSLLKATTVIVSGKLNDVKSMFTYDGDTYQPLTSNT